MSVFYEATAFLYDPRGRCNRKGLLIVLSITLSLQIVIGLLIWQTNLSLTGPTVTIAKILFVWVALSATSQRLHDLGLSGLWIVGVVAGLIIWWMTSSTAVFLMLMANLIEPSNSILLVLVCLMYLPVLVGVCWLHCAKGQDTENRYGDVPGPTGFSYRSDPVEVRCENNPLPA